MKKYRLFILFLLVCLFALTGCGEEDNKQEDKKDDQQEEKKSEIEILPGEVFIEIPVGGEDVIDFEVKKAEYEVTYTGYDKTIVDVDEDGFISALKEGVTEITVSITATDGTGYLSKSYIITVNVKEDRTVNVSYEANIDGVSIAADTIKYGADYEFKTAPTVENYEFLGFTLAKNSTDYITNLQALKKDTKVYANYKLIKKPEVSFFVDGEELESERKVLNIGDKINPNTVAVTESGFIGWVSNKALPEIITGEVTITEDTVFTAVFTKSNYSITYDLQNGDWEKTYYTIEELAASFVSDYNKNGGSASDASKLDTAYLDSGAFANAYSKQAMKDKYMWLYKALCEKAGKMSTLNPETVDLTSYDAKKFYIAEICGFLTKSKHTDSNFKTTSVDYSDLENQLTIIKKGPVKSEVKGTASYTTNSTVKLISPLRTGYEFVGWEVNGVLLDSFKKTFVGDLVLVAKWEQATLPSEITFTNIPEDGIKLYENLQLKWTVGPTDAYDKQVYFQSLTPSVLSIDEKGYVSTISKGTGRIKVKFSANSKFEKIVEIDVVSGDFFDISYETTSYTIVGKSIKLNSVYYDLRYNIHNVTWASLTPSIATVDANGNVTPLSVGVATIRSSYDETHYIDFVVTVLDSNISDELQFILDNHNSNALTVYNLGIGGSNPAYYYDVVGSVNDILFDEFKIDRTYYNKLPSGTKNYGNMTSVEFICVHYTGNMAKGADADNNIDYFNNLEYQASIHYVTGRTNLYGDYNEDDYYAFAGLNEAYAGWHASTGKNAVYWDATGVKVAAGDPEIAVVTITDNNKYAVNGKETKISIPTPPDGYTVKGNVLTVGGQKYTAMNAQGVVATVIGDEYYIARTYWGSQRSPKAICTYGGNTNSIGIESCVDIGSDLVHTWHVTAQLVAKLMLDYDLSIDRVVGHHFFSAKDCPQPLLANDMQLWYEFIDMVKAEYEILTTYKDVTITAKAVNSEGILSDKGLLKQDNQSHIVTYEVTIEKGGKKQTITLATAVESYYCYEGTRKALSLQNQGYDIK